MISTQPFFIHGIDNPDEAKTNAFGAMFMFIATFAVSLVGLWYDTHGKDKEVESAASAPEAEYHLATGDMPTYGTSA
jgi:hypothetical protein